MAKGSETHDRILDRAFRLASREGLEGLSIAALATETGLSKSGLFAHFGSKEQLQLEVLQRATERFEQTVWAAAVKAPRGEPRLGRLFEGWLSWVDDPESPGGCVFMAAAAELDDREGKPRDLLVGTQRELLEAVAKAARIAMDEGHFRSDLDCEQFAFELYGVLLSYHHFRRLLRDPLARDRASRAFQRLVERSKP